MLKNLGGTVPGHNRDTYGTDAIHTDGRVFRIDSALWTQISIDASAENGRIADAIMFIISCSSCLT